MVVRRTRTKATEAEAVKADVTPAKKPKVEDSKVASTETKQETTEPKSTPKEAVKPANFNWIHLNSRLSQVRNGKFNTLLAFANDIGDGMGNTRVSFIISNKVWSETIGNGLKKSKQAELATKIIEHFSIQDFESLTEDDILKLSCGPSSSGILATFRANKHTFSAVKKVVREADEEKKISEIVGYDVSLTVDGKVFSSETKSKSNIFMEKEILATEYLSSDEVKDELTMFLIDQQNKSFRDSNNGTVESANIINGAAYSIDSLIATIGLPKIDNPFDILTEYAKETKNKVHTAGHSYENLKEGECCMKVTVDDGCCSKVVYGTSFTKKAARKVAGLAMLYLLQQEDVLDEEFNLIVEEEEEVQGEAEKEVKSSKQEVKKEPEPKTDDEIADIKTATNFNTLCCMLKQEATYETTEHTGDNNQKSYTTTCKFQKHSESGKSSNKKLAKREAVKAMVKKFEATEKMTLDVYLKNLRDNLKRSKEGEPKNGNAADVKVNGNRKRKAN